MIADLKSAANAVKQTIIKLKKAKVFYYAKNILRQAIPVILYQSKLQHKLKAINKYNKAELSDRVNYYNKLDNIKQIDNNAIALQNMQMFKSPKAYNFDTFEYTRYFKKNMKANFLFGDVTIVIDVPTIQKSRPIAGDNSNAILLKLDKKRHFIFLNDTIPFAEKKNILIGRGVMSQPHRVKFMNLYFDNPLCDLGEVNTKGGNPKWLKPKIPISTHLQYKFILSLEGNDVATNLKWILSSNSIAVMPKPKYETWFMEGLLVPDFHYIVIKDDYSDLEEKLQYYINNPQLAQAIVNNANQYTKQFLDSKKEDLISLLVLQKYFYYTSQTNAQSLLDHV